MTETKVCKSRVPLAVASPDPSVRKLQVPYPHSYCLQQGPAASRCRSCTKPGMLPLTLPPLSCISKLFISKRAGPPLLKTMSISCKSQDQVQINVFNKRTNNLFESQNSEIQTKYLRNNKTRNVHTYRKYTNCTSLTTHHSLQKIVRSRKTKHCLIVLSSRF